jgi:hypothetical protein
VKVRGPAVVAAGTLGFIVAAGAGFASASALLRFSTVAHGEKAAGTDESRLPTVQRPGEVAAAIVTSATDMTYLYYVFSKSDQTKFDSLDWDSHFVIAAWAKERTTGYRLTISRVALQRVSPSKRQLCVIASVEGPRPGEAVTPRASFAAHAIALSSRRFRRSQYQYAIPENFVVRSTTGQLLAVSLVGGSLVPGAWKPFHGHISGKPSICKRTTRDESARMLEVPKL